MSHLNVKYRLAAWPQVIWTPENSAWAWHGMAACCLTTSHAFRDSCVVPSVALYTNYWHSSLESLMIHFLHTFLDDVDSLPGCEVVLLFSNSGAHFLRRSGTLGLSFLLTPSWNACFGVCSHCCTFPAREQHSRFRECCHTMLSEKLGTALYLK